MKKIKEFLRKLETILRKEDWTGYTLEKNLNQTGIYHYMLKDKFLKYVLDFYENDNLLSEGEFLVVLDELNELNQLTKEDVEKLKSYVGRH